MLLETFLKPNADDAWAFHIPRSYVQRDSKCNKCAKVGHWAKHASLARTRGWLRWSLLRTNMMGRSSSLVGGDRVRVTILRPPFYRPRHVRRWGMGEGKNETFFLSPASTAWKIQDGGWTFYDLSARSKKSRLLCRLIWWWVFSGRNYWMLLVEVPKSHGKQRSS